MRLPAALVGILVVLSSCCSREEAPLPPRDGVGSSAQLRGAWFPAGAGRAILDLRIGDGPTVGNTGRVGLWLDEAAFEGGRPSREPDIEVELNQDSAQFPWSSDFFGVVEYDEEWESITLHAEIEVDHGVYVAIATIERTSAVSAIWEFFREESLVVEFQPLIRGKMGFKNKTTTTAVFDLGTESDDLKVQVDNEIPLEDPDFGHIWIWRYTEEPRGWPTPAQSDACHDETLSTAVDNHTITTDLNNNDKSEVDAGAMVWIYAMVEYVEDVGGLTVRKYWQYKSPGMPATVGVSREFLTRRKANPTGIGPSGL